MFNIGTPEMVLIAFIALVVVGPQRLPSLFRQIGRGLAQFRQIQDDVKDMVNLDQYIDLKAPDGNFITPPAPKPTPHQSRVAAEGDLDAEDETGATDDLGEADRSEQSGETDDAIGRPPAQNGVAATTEPTADPPPVPDVDEPPLSAP